MNDSTRRILRWCAGENRGMRINLARLLSNGCLTGTGKLVISPVDQRLEHGPGQLM
jgi:class I fructose-bisphosphate aldolase